MKFTAWRTWLWNQLGRFLRLKRPRTLATATCVAMGLATAWGGEAEADITFKVEVTPAHDLLDAFVYFGNNATGAGAYPLGSLSADEHHTFLLDLPGTSGFYLDDTPEYYKPGGIVPVGFGVAGIYELNGEYGIVSSFVDSSPIDDQQSWDEFFDFDIGGYPSVTEVDIVEDYFAELDHAPRHWDRTPLGDVFSSYTGDHNNTTLPDTYREKQLLTPYGSEATLIAFGSTRFAGTAIVTIVPEPSSIVLLVTMGGMFPLCARNWCR